jgi:hypothetical protein
MHAELDGRLMPKTSAAFEYGFKWGESGTRWGDGSTLGTSAANAVIRHQLEQAGYPTSGVSCTPHFERARFYALHGGTLTEGFIYKIDTAILRASGVQIFRVRNFSRDPSVPEDDEHILVVGDGRPVPHESICAVSRVTTA